MADDGVIKVGDRIRMSVALIRQIAEEPGATSEVVIVEVIATEPDGSKILHVSSIEAPEG